MLEAGVSGGACLLLLTNLRGKIGIQLVWPVEPLSLSFICYPILSASAPACTLLSSPYSIYYFSSPASAAAHYSAVVGFLQTGIRRSFSRKGWSATPTSRYLRLLKSRLNCTLHSINDATASSGIVHGAATWQTPVCLTRP